MSEVIEIPEITEDLLDNEETESSEDVNIEVGNIYTGEVVKIKPFGAIVSLPGKQLGLVHISQISSGFVQNVEEILEEGDEVSVRVLTKDPATNKISLSMKDIPQFEYDEDDPDGGYYVPPAPVVTAASAAAFEEKFKAWQKVSNDRIAGLNKRNKRR